MNSVIRNVVDLSADERHVYEALFAQALQDNQRVVVQLIDADDSKSGARDTCVDGVLEPYTIWAEFSDEEIADLESEILDRSESRPA
jgi:hypothetical protein